MAVWAFNFVFFGVLFAAFIVFREQCIQRFGDLNFEVEILKAKVSKLEGKR